MIGSSRTARAFTLAPEPNRRFELVGATASWRDGLRLVRTLKPSLVIVDTAVTGPDGLQLVREIQASRLLTASVVRVRAADVEIAAEALESGASGVASDHSSDETLLDVAEAAIRGLVKVSPDLTVALGADVVTRLGSVGLTARELEVLRLHADGARASQAAETLHLTVATIREHGGSARRKLGAATTAQAVAKALRRGLIE